MGVRVPTSDDAAPTLLLRRFSLVEVTQKVEVEALDYLFSRFFWAARARTGSTDDSLRAAIGALRRPATAFPPVLTEAILDQEQLQDLIARFEPFSVLQEADIDYLVTLASSLPRPLMVVELFRKALSQRDATSLTDHLYVSATLRALQSNVGRSWNDRLRERFRVSRYRARARFGDRTKFPRRCWYPVVRETSGDAPGAKEFHTQVSQTVWRTSTLLLGASIYCAVTLGRPDRSMLLAEEVDLPILGVGIGYDGFLVVAPLILIGLTVYLHVYLWQWRRLKTVSEFDRSALIFNLKSPTGRILSYLIFFWTTPLILLLFARKGAPYSPYGALSSGIAVVCTTFLVWLQIMTATDEFRRRKHHVLQWLALILFPVMVFLIAQRTWDLSGSDLSNKILEHVDLSHANLNSASLDGAQLRDVDLRNADLSGSSFVGVRLTDVRLAGAEITDANIDIEELALAGYACVACGERDFLFPDAEEERCPAGRSGLIVVIGFAGFLWPVRQFFLLVKDIYKDRV